VWLLVAPVFLAARTHRWPGAPAVLLAAAPQFVLAAAGVERGLAAGRGHPLHVLG
jgi:hypothetical protein